MAGAVANAILDWINHKGEDVVDRKISSMFGVKEETEKLSRALKRIQALLNDARKREIKEQSVKLWLSELQDVAYDVEDLLDDMNTEDLRLQVKKLNERDMGQVSTSFGSLDLDKFVSDVSFKYDMASKLGETSSKLGEILEYGEKLGLKEVLQNPSESEYDETSSVQVQKSVFGRQNDKKNILSLLLPDEDHEESSIQQKKKRKRNEREVDHENTKYQPDVPVISIVGMDGIGKTTLAQMAYNDEKVQEHFEVTMWVCVSQGLDVKKTTKAMIGSGPRTSYHRTHFLHLLQVRLEKILNGKRFLLVLDDLLNLDSTKWEKIRAPLRVGKEGSRVMITTSSTRVSTMMGATRPYFLDVLSDEDCWSLFVQQAFPGVDFNAFPNLVIIGKEIIKKCKGLPLAAKQLGSHLRFTRDENEWNDNLRSEIWDLPEGSTNILPALRLSYHHLPAELMLCFAFCCIFPKGHEYDKNDLILLWMAHGFIRREDGEDSKRTEDIGSRYFDELLARSFFQCSKDNKSRYVMHDLLHDLAQSFSRYESIKIEGDSSPTITNKCLHASIISVNLEEKTLEAFRLATKLRTFLLLVRDDIFDRSLRASIQKVLPHLFNLASSLRVLDLSGFFITELPDCISNLKHLRYLDLSWTSIKRLPESTGNLFNLQTLKLNGCSKLLELPKSTCNLINLRHLALCGSFRDLFSTPARIGRLTTLQTLSKFTISKESGRGISELRGMSSLGGELSIFGLENVVDVQDAKAAALKNKPHLRKLELSWNNTWTPTADILEGLQPSSKLEHLRIHNYGGVEFPSWLVSLSNLVSLYLFDCVGIQSLHYLGQLHFLKHLKLSTLPTVKIITFQLLGTDKCKGLQSLETLELRQLSNLENWEGDMPCLQELEIMDCPRLMRLPCLLPTLTKLQIRNCQILIDLPNLPSCETLVLFECQERLLRSLPLFRSLSSLTFYGISGKESFGSSFSEMSLPALEKLEISRVRLNKLVGFEVLTSIRHLVIKNCKELSFMKNTPSAANIRVSNPSSSSTDVEYHQLGLHNLTSLENLIIRSCSDLVSMADEVLPSMLQEIEISWCRNLETLPKRLQSHNSLKELKIWDCPKLGCLSEESLPQTLQFLSIRGCLALEARCRKNVGEDWPKIAHVARICIDGVWNFMY